VLVREFLHQFMTILAIKIGQWLGPLHAVFASRVLSSGASFLFDLADCSQGASFPFFSQEQPAASALSRSD
jgi:hypothetical protein